ncbi:MAG: galactosamine-6-phosphate isomerase [Mucilaginibacter sp.]|nr:galactosamine-6-phosphate isomerase [Mucilaginibacter sp.]
MNINRCNTLAELNELASALIIHELQVKPASLVCAATGNSPTGVYQKLVEKKDSIAVDSLTFIKLDEWYGLGIDDAGSCEYYLHKNLLEPLKISPAKYIAFDGKSEDAEKECSRVANYLDEHGPIDLCILGLGQNGHIAFNEPAENLQPRTHLGTLSETSLTHAMVKGTDAHLKFGLTLGMADILQSKKIILLVNGRHKNAVMGKLLEQKISTQLPASFLWLHAAVECFYCANDN